jgi:hypothetical protein
MMARMAEDVPHYWLQIDAIGEIADLPGGGQLPNTAELVYGDPVAGLLLELDLRLDDAGQLVVAEIRPGDGPPFTAAVLASIHWEQVLRRLTVHLAQAARSHLRKLSDDPPAANEPTLRPDEAHEAGELALQARGRRWVTDELLRQVAEIVTANPHTPNKAVQDKLSTGSRNATRWIAAARARGFLKED